MDSVCIRICPARPAAANTMPATIYSQKNVTMNIIIEAEEAKRRNLSNGFRGFRKNPCAAAENTTKAARVNTLTEATTQKLSKARRAG